MVVYLPRPVILGCKWLTIAGPAALKSVQEFKKRIVCISGPLVSFHQIPARSAEIIRLTAMKHAHCYVSLQSALRIL